jgi:uncharacterized protein YciI
LPNLCVIDLTYIVDLAEVEVHMEAHRAFLQRQYEAGMFLASGRKEPRTGGVILATGDRSALQCVLADDPFNRHGIASYTVTAFLPTMTSPELASFRHVHPQEGAEIDE